MHFQWYPGHMTKARRQMQEDMKLIDLVIELVDARVPLGSRNPDIDELGKNKARLILMNKADLAEGLPGEDRAGSKEGHQEPAGAGDGSGDSQCGKIYLYQYLCWEGLCQNGQ